MRKLEILILIISPGSDKISRYQMQADGKKYSTDLKFRKIILWVHNKSTWIYEVVQSRKITDKGKKKKKRRNSVENLWKNLQTLGEDLWDDENCCLKIPTSISHKYDNIDTQYYAQMWNFE